MDTSQQDSDSLEGNSGSVIETQAIASPTPDSSSDVRLSPDQKAATPAPKPRFGGGRHILKRFNIYLLLFVLLLVVSGAALLVMALTTRSAPTPKISSQTLSSDTLRQLAKTDATVGDPKQVLNVQSNAVFAGKVLIRDSLDVAGPIHVNGSLSLPGITVNGDTTLDQVEINKGLNLGGDASLLGQVSIKKNLSVSGNGTFGGTLTASQVATTQLQILGDLVLTSHVLAGGPSPSRTNGNALGNGGTASISGSDSAGSININTGSNPAVGCLVTVNFTSKYNSNPHVVMTASNSSAATLSYYVNRTSSGFSVCTAGATAPAANSSFSFDYIVLG